MIGLWFLGAHEWRFVSLDYIIFEIFERYFVLFDIWCWHLCCGCFLKIFRTNISTYINFSWRPCSCLQWWCWHLVARLQAMHLSLLIFGWRKIWYGIWKKVVLFCKCKLIIFFHFYSIVQIDETLLLLTFLLFFRMWVSGFGCGRDVRHQASHHLQFVDEHWPSMSNAF